MNASFKSRVEELRKGGAKVVPEGEMKEILKQYGVPVPHCKLCVSTDEAAAFAADAGFPVVLKLSSDKVLHKTELKGVRLDLNSDQEVKSTFLNMDEAFRKQQVPGYIGILVEKQSEKGTELIVGLQYDVVFGPVMMMGLGGIFTDIIQDVVFRMLPLTKDEIIEALKTLKAWPLLNGYRGSVVLATDELIDALHAISVFGTDYAGQYDSVDFNPVIARQDLLRRGGPEGDRRGCHWARPTDGHAASRPVAAQTGDTRPSVGEKIGSVAPHLGLRREEIDRINSLVRLECE